MKGKNKLGCGKIRVRHSRETEQHVGKACSGRGPLRRHGWRVRIADNGREVEWNRSPRALEVINRIWALRARITEVH